MEYRVEVIIRLKKGITDAEGETVQKSLELLGYATKKVESAKVYYVIVESKTEAEAKATVEEACERLLANPVINEYSIKVV